MSSNPSLVKLIARTLKVPVERLTPDARFDQLGRTSFQEIELLTEIEDEFSVRLDFEEFVTLATVGELTEAVAKAGGG